MKTIYWLIIVVILIGAGTGGFLLWKNKKSEKEEKESVPDKNDIPNVPTQGTEEVRQLQIRLNALLPTSYTKLVVDGIYGKKTADAEKYVMDNQDKLPVTVQIGNKTVTKETALNSGKTFAKAVALGPFGPAYLTYQVGKRLIDWF